MISDKSKAIIVERVYDRLEDTTIDCPDCESMTDDPQYTCTTCWCEGGNGTMQLSTLLGNIYDVIRLDD